MTVEAFADPFRHWILSDFADPALCRAAFAATPPADWSGWGARYDNDCERGKRTCNDLAALPPDWRNLLLWLNSPSTAGRLGALTGVEGLRPDPTLYGAGVHVTDPGGWLNWHVDFARHPSGLERRLSLILFLNPVWREAWGGAFEFYDDEARAVVKRAFPSIGRAVVFENGDLSYHGTQRTSADAPPRVTAACYFLAEPRPGCVRRRALFVPRR